MVEDELPKASEEFWDAIIHAGTGIVDCGFCDRTHYTTSGDYEFEEGELDKLIEDAKKDPDKYVLHNNEDSISLGSLAGKQAVYDCPCNAASKYEKFIFENREMIAKYLESRAKKMTEQAEELTGLSSRVSESVEFLE